MKKNKLNQKLTILLAAIAFVGLLPAQGQEKTIAPTTTTQMTVTVRTLGENKRMPEISHEDVIVKQGKDRLKVTNWTPARGDRAGLDLFILIDDASDTSLGSQLGDLSSFINAQASTTAVGVG